jgi:hypothetical protein
VLVNGEGPCYRARAMFVGVLRLTLGIVGARTLKDKRSVVRSFKERVQNRLRVSVAEVGALDDPRRAVFGVACVSGSAAMCDRVLADVAAMASTLPDAVLADRATEIIPFGAAGRGVEGGIEQALGRDDQGWDEDEELP